MFRHPDRLEQPLPPYYFGCVAQAGHFYWAANRQPTAPVEWIGTGYGGLTPWEQVDGPLMPRQRKQGNAALHHKDGWTAIDIADYTVDKRGNSHSAFFFNAVLNFEDIVRAARESFPEVMRRIEAAGPIILMEGTE